MPLYRRVREDGQPKIIRLSQAEKAALLPWVAALGPLNEKLMEELVEKIRNASDFLDDVKWEE